MEIELRFENFTIEVNLLNTPTGVQVYKNLPFEGRINKWGDEIYFPIPIEIDLERDQGKRI